MSTAPGHAVGRSDDLLARLAPWSISAKAASRFVAEDDVDFLERDRRHRRYLAALRARAGSLQTRSSRMASTTMARPASKPMRDVDRVERPHHRLAEPVGADQRRDHHHRQRQHDALGDAGHDRRQGIGQLDLPQELALGRAEGLAGLEELLRHRRDAEMGEPDRRGDGEDHGGDQARHHAEAEQHQRRDQVDEGRHRLHQVEERPDGGVEPGPVRGGDADRHADRDATRAWRRAPAPASPASPPSSRG